MQLALMLYGTLDMIQPHGNSVIRNIDIKENLLMFIHFLFHFPKVSLCNNLWLLDNDRYCVLSLNGPDHLDKGFLSTFWLVDNMYIYNLVVDSMYI